MPVTARKRKTRWLDNALIIGPNVTLCMSYEEYVSVIKPTGRIEPKWNTPGRCISIHNSSGQLVIVVLQDYIGRKLVEAIGLINHEVSHALDEYFNIIGEKQPSGEFRAYAYQAMSQNLIEEFFSRVILSKDKETGTLVVKRLKTD